MVNRFFRIRTELEEVAATDGLGLSISSEPLFQTQCNRLGINLIEIDTFAKALQRRGATLEECRYLLDTPTQSIAEQENNPTAPFYVCTMNDSYIKLSSAHSPSTVFKSDVIKIHRGEFETMTAQEQDACEHLKTAAQSIGSKPGFKDE